MSYSSTFLADPVGTSVLAAAVQWLQSTLLGTVAMTIAILAVASVGFNMLTGRLEVRRGATVLIGCFILFGAPSIAAGLQRAISSATPAANRLAPSSPVSIPEVAEIPAAMRSPGYDPYAGAAVPSNR